MLVFLTKPVGGGSMKTWGLRGTRGWDSPPPDKSSTAGLWLLPQYMGTFDPRIWICPNNALSVDLVSHPGLRLRLRYSGALHHRLRYPSQIESTRQQSCPRVGWTRGSGRVTILPDFGGSGQHFGFISFSLIISLYLNRYEPSNTAFGFIDYIDI